MHPVSSRIVFIFADGLPKCCVFLALFLDLFFYGDDQVKCWRRSIASRIWSGIYRTSSTEKVALVGPAIKQQEQRREQEQVLQYGRDTTPNTT